MGFINRAVKAFNYIFKRDNVNAGKVGRLSKNWRPLSKPFHNDIKGKEKLILGRARFLEFNSPQLNSMLQAIERNVPRTGIKFQSKIRNSDNLYNKKLNDLIEMNFSVWSRRELCDVSGRFTFEEMQNVIARRVFVDGGIFVKFVTDINCKYSVKLQLLEVDLLDLDKTSDLKNGNTIIQGVEIDEYRKTVAYWLRKTPLYGFEGYLQTESYRIPVEEIMLIYKPFRPEQIHPFSMIAPIILKLNDLLEIDENELVKEKIQTTMSIAITKNEPIEFGDDEDKDEDGDVEDLFKSGVVAYLNPGEDIKTIESNKNQSGYQIFNKIHERNVSKAVGISAEQTTGDLSEVNYSSARTGSIEDEKYFKMFQKFIIERFCQPVAERFVDMMFLSGKIKAVDYINNPYKYYKFKWLTPGNDWIDPLKQANAEIALISNGLKSRTEYFASRGLDFEEEMENLKEEKKIIESNNLEEYLILKKEEKNKEDDREEEK